jgi:hypothetical protein
LAQNQSRLAKALTRPTLDQALKNNAFALDARSKQIRLLPAPFWAARDLRARHSSLARASHPHCVREYSKFYSPSPENDFSQRYRRSPFAPKHLTRFFLIENQGLRNLDL